MSEDLRERLVEALAKVYEYEHALEHIADESDEYHEPGRCIACKALARSALDGMNREMCREWAREALDE